MTYFTTCNLLPSLGGKYAQYMVSYTLMVEQILAHFSEESVACSLKYKVPVDVRLGKTPSLTNLSVEKMVNFLPYNCLAL